MNGSQPNPPPIPGPPPLPKNNSFDKIKWLLVAFIPAVFGIVCISMNTWDSSWLVGFFILDIICSIASGAALMAGAGPGWGKTFLTFSMMLALFALNAFIALSIGCVVMVSR